LRLARRLYEARKKLAVTLNLRRIVIGGRLPRYHKRRSEMSPEEYVRKAMVKEIRDPVITAQRANGFTIVALLKDYLPSDTASGGHALLMEWLNTRYVPTTGRAAGTGRVRVASVQYQMRRVSSFDEFMTQCEFFIDTAADYRCDFVIFPELLTTQLFPLLPEERPGVTARQLDQFTRPYLDFFRRMAIEYAVNIIGGSHLMLEGDDLRNVSFLFRRDGSVGRQDKIHVCPSEFRWWGVKPGNHLEVFDTDRGKIAILICYDVEFPELVRIAVSKGARIIFVPYNTDIRMAHLRVRYCAHARCIENHIYAVLCGATGNLPSVSGADIHYAQSAILTPSDIPFSRDGIGAQATPNTETLLVHELDLDALKRTHRTGAVRPWLDRRTDLYGVQFKEGDDDKVV
jgi:predicted amidohydrolase